jgi:hypothetical protein
MHNENGLLKIKVTCKVSSGLSCLLKVTQFECLFAQCKTKPNFIHKRIVKKKTLCMYIQKIFVYLFNVKFMFRNRITWKLFNTQSASLLKYT